MAIDLAALEAPIEPVTFKTGRTVEVEPFGPSEYELWGLVKAGQTQHILPLLRRTLPKATDDDLDTLTPRSIAYIMGAAQHKADLILAALDERGKGGAAAPEAAPLPSAANASRSTSSRKSRARSGSRSTSSGASRST
jgi:hypothetical protein